MTQNLKLNNTTLRSLDSDMTKDIFVIPQSNLSKFSTSSVEAKVYNDSYYGVYYNWYAATARKTDFSATQESVCPKSWKLPNTENVNRIIKNYTFREAISNPINWTLSGVLRNSTDFHYCDPAYNAMCDTNNGANYHYWVGAIWLSDGSFNASLLHSNSSTKYDGSLQTLPGWNCASWNCRYVIRCLSE